MTDELLQLLSLTWNEVKNDPALYLKLQKQYALEKRDNGCCLKVFDAYFKNHKNKLTQKKMAKVEKSNSENYELKEGAQVYLRSKNIIVTNANITDELGAAILDEMPGHRGNFVRTPGGETPAKKSTGKKKDDSGSEDPHNLKPKEVLSKAEIKEKLAALGVPEKEYKLLNLEKLQELLAEKQK